jgi:hypothetical protein
MLSTALPESAVPSSSSKAFVAAVVDKNTTTSAVGSIVSAYQNAFELMH